MSLPLKNSYMHSLRNVGFPSSFLAAHCKNAIFQSTLAHSKQSEKINYINQLNARKVFEETRNLGQKPTTSMYLEAITAYGYSKDVDKVISTWKGYTRHYKLKSFSHHRYIIALAQCGDIPSIYHVLRDLKTKHYVKHEEISLCLAEFVTACVRKNHAYLALKTTGDFISYAQAWDDTALQHIARLLWKIYESHLPISSNISPASFEKFVYHYREKLDISSRAKTKHHFMYSHLFTMFKLIINTHPLITPSTKTCDLIIESQLIGGDYAAIKFILAYMQKNNIQPTTHTVSLLLKSLGSYLPGNHVKSLYIDLKKKNKVNADMYGAFIKVFSDKADTLNVQAVVSDMKNDGLELENNSCISIVEGFVNKGDLIEATEWLQNNHEIVRKNLDSYAVLMESFIAKGYWDACMQSHTFLVKKKIKEVYTNRRIVKALLTSRFASGKYWDTCRTQLRTLDITFTPTTIFRIVRNLTEIENNGRPLVPGKAIVKALQIMETELDVHLNAEGIGRLITALGKRGDLLQGFELYNWVRDDKSNTRVRCGSSSIYSALMYSSLINNNFRILERAWVDMQYRKWFIECENGNKGEKLEHTLAKYNVLLNGYASKLPLPDITRLKRTYQRMLKRDIGPNLTTYNILIKAFVNGGNMEAANQVYQKMVYSGIEPDTITANTLLNGWILQKNLEEVENFIHQLKPTVISRGKSSMDIVTFNLLVQSFLGLDSKIMGFTRILKNENKWHEAYGIQKTQKILTSTRIWNVFETSTGYSKELLDNFYKHCIDDNEPISADSYKFDLEDSHNSLINLIDRPKPFMENKETEDSFIRFFSKTTEPDHVTYKLFMKAFFEKNDFHSASKIKKWMDFRLKK